MKSFFIWLGIQGVFARVLFGLSAELWQTMHVAGSDSIGYFILPAALICIVETIVSGCILYDVIVKDKQEVVRFKELEFYASHPEMRSRTY